MNGVIVFGGSRGIGKNIAVSFLKKGWNVTAVSRSKKKLDEIKREFPELHVSAADVGNMIEVEYIFNEHKKSFGHIPYIVVDTAGIQGTLGPLWELSQEDFESVIKTNLIGSFNVTKVAIETMIKEKTGGSVILFSGGGSCYARPNFSSYGISKTGLLRLVETVSEELTIKGHSNIIINAIAPGGVKTEMTEEILKAGNIVGEKAYQEALEISKTGGTNPEDIFRLVEFLSNPEANKGISGKLIHYKDDYINLSAKQNEKEFFETGKLRRIPIPRQEAIEK